VPPSNHDRHSDSDLDAWLSQPGHHLIARADADYPKLLLEIPDPPAVLYGKGRRELLSSNALAIVGSRNATPQGAKNAEVFAEAVSNTGLCVVSGLALGIDAAAHRGGLKGSASTIAVVGTGLDIVYPLRNKALTAELALRGLILSEFPLGTPPLPGNFPRRNRIISGLTQGCLVVEAALASGSLITARLAADQGRDVFAIPGSIHSPFSKGCHHLIKQGAKLVESAEDILDELGYRAQQINVATPNRINAVACKDPLLDAIGFDPESFDTLLMLTGIPVAVLSAKLVEWEILGAVAPLPGGRYQRIT
jgi:DNA processing protein